MSGRLGDSVTLKVTDDIVGDGSVAGHDMPLNVFLVPDDRVCTNFVLGGNIIFWTMYL